MQIKGLPILRGQQREVLYLPNRRHDVVLGTAGSGKSTLAIYRAVYLSGAHIPQSDRAGFQGRTLLITYNKCLVRYLENFLSGVPSEQRLNTLEVQNYHRFARGYLNSRGRMSRNCVASDNTVQVLTRKAIDSAEISTGTNTRILGRSLEFFIEEFRWLARHGIRNVEDYIGADRLGRSSTRVPRNREIWQRTALFAVYERYKALRGERGLDFDWHDLAHAVIEELGKDTGERRYRHVVIDEGQDLSPTELKSLSALIPEDGTITFLGDIAQQIYGYRMSWRDAGFADPTIWRLQQNFRNTREIARLALAISSMPSFPDDPDLVEPAQPTAGGPLPALISFREQVSEDSFVVKRSKGLAKNGSVAVLFRDGEQVDRFKASVNTQVTVLRGDLTRWPEGPGLFTGTYHAAKGLEFDAVVLPHVASEHLPHPKSSEAVGHDRALERDLQLLYVAVTRAKSELILTYTGNRTSLLPDRPELFGEVRQ